VRGEMFVDSKELVVLQGWTAASSSSSFLGDFIVCAGIVRTKFESLKACAIPPAYVYSLMNVHMELFST
jgi:hypothetical protein